VSNGYLGVQVLPTTAQVFVDGLYVGTVNDLRGSRRGQPLAPGAHRLELRAPGYEPVVVDIRIDPGETTIYRGEMTLVPSTPPPAAPANPTPPSPTPRTTAPAKTFYVIPGCYAGDKRPDVALLPRGCDVSKLRQR
jgi:hypothetical protein